MFNDKTKEINTFIDIIDKTLQTNTLLQRTVLQWQSTNFFFS